MSNCCAISPDYNRNPPKQKTAEPFQILPSPQGLMVQALG
jgi:hypothetical protein